MAQLSSEFTVEGAYQYNHKNVGRWLWSHVARYRVLLLAGLILPVIDFIFFGLIPVYIGRAVDVVLTGEGALQNATLMVLAVSLTSGLAHLGGNLVSQTIAQHLAADAREELYRSLLGKSQIFHDRQRVGDIMARATEDVFQLSAFIVPGMLFATGTVLGIVVPLLYIALIEPAMLLVPVIFILGYIVAVKAYAARLLPVMRNQRSQYGKMNSVLEESISGIEVVKASTQEWFERIRFGRTARRFRDLFVHQGQIEARYLPLLMFGVALGLAFLHSLWLHQQGSISIAEIVAIMGLVNILRFPTFISIFSISLLQTGIAGAERILSIITADTEIDQNIGGHQATIKGTITFENVTYDFGDGKPVLADIKFSIEPGQTVAIVGQTGSGKSTLTQLVNRTYDVTSGRLLIDGMDVRDWNIASLRSQIANIEQDIFLFSRSIRDNVAFGMPDATTEMIEQAAKDAQAHEFIEGFSDGYDTKIGDRGVTLSGGQRQRIALARAFLADPRILILDDSTSAIDSATEDEIQKAIGRIQEGRTTLLITHRLSQIRWADLIVVLDSGRVVGIGSHEHLLKTSALYRRIFARYEVELPPLEVEVV
ncbi:MAG: ABC transporter ATP-binding protein/permease [Chloroflexi bacterium]|nr:ABC transporter ATP-binding protein/permease [Chloroflexota bacterium]